MTIANFDQLPIEEKRALLTTCCGSQIWVDKMLTAFPVEDLIDLLQDAEEKWYECSEQDWLEAFSHHPKIGDTASLKEKFASTATWAAGEQAGVDEAPDNTISELAEGNRVYEDKFGYIFIVCATGRSAEEMLALLQARLANYPATEINIAADEQNKITQLRLQKLFVE